MKQRTLKRVYQDTMGTPFLTILFLSECIKQCVVDGYVFTPLVIQFCILTVGSLVVWMLNDTITGEANRETIIGDD